MGRVVANTYTMTYEYPHYISDDCKTYTCLGSSGRIGLWIAFGCMFVPMLIFWFKAASKPAGQRKFEYLSMAINGIASLAYLTMATGYGAKIVNGQEFFFARYIDWTLTTPLMLVDLILLAHGAKAKMETILHIVAVDMLMVVGGLIGALQGADESKWVFFAFSMFMFCPIFFYLLFDGSFKATSTQGTLACTPRLHGSLPSSGAATPSRGSCTRAPAPSPSTPLSSCTSSSTPSARACGASSSPWVATLSARTQRLWGSTPRWVALLPTVALCKFRLFSVYDRPLYTTRFWPAPESAI